MRKIGFVFVFLLLIGIKGYCQGIFLSGYIITNDNDTVYGEINEKFSNKGSFIYFRKSGKEKIKYEACEIKGYSIENVNSCMSVKTYAGTGFGKIIVDGYYRLVYIKMYSKPEFSVEPSYYYNRRTTHTLNYGRKLLYSNYKIYRGEEDLFYVSRATFKGRTEEFFSDYPYLSEQIKKKELKFSDLALIVQKYNLWKSKN